MATTSAALSTTAPLVRQPDICPSIPSHDPLPPLPSGEEPRAHGSCRRRGGGPAAGARWRTTRAAASTVGLLLERLRKAPDGEGPKTSAPRPLRAGRAHRARLGTPKAAPQGAAPQR